MRGAGRAWVCGDDVLVTAVHKELEPADHRVDCACVTRNSKSAHQAHTKHLGWYLEFEFRVTHRFL